MSLKVYLKKDVPKLGLSGEIISVSEGYAKNFLFPRKLAIEVTTSNKDFFKKKEKLIENRKAVLESETSMLAEKIKQIEVTIKKKMHNDMLYGSLNEKDIVDGLQQQGVKVAKNQIILPQKSIRKKGKYTVTIKLSSRLKPTLLVKLLPE